MTNNNHPITPPPELVKQWSIFRIEDKFVIENWTHIATQAARWGADMELEACCEWLEYTDEKEKLRAARRSKPPSLKEQAYNALDTYIYGEPDPNDKERAYNIIRRALNALPD